MQDRDAARTARVARAFVLAALVLPVLTACGASAGDGAPSLSETIAARDTVAADAHALMLDRSAVFLRDKWGPVSLPDESIERWVAATAWGPTMARCISDAGYPGVVSADGGERLDFSGVRTTDARELFEIDVATYRCQSLYPVRSWFDDEIRGIEAPWALAYTRSVLVPCLLASGHDVPPLPDDDRFRAEWRTELGFDAFALVGDGPSERTRAQARCPAAESMLDGAP